MSYRSRYKQPIDRSVLETLSKTALKHLKTAEDLQLQLEEKEAWIRELIPAAKRLLTDARSASRYISRELQSQEGVAELDISIARVWSIIVKRYPKERW